MIMELVKSKMAYLTNGIAHGSENEPFTATHIKMDERQNHEDDREKIHVPKEHTLYDTLCTKAKKK